ncbi:uncharacterized protein N7515_009054 [Penicillium bovifimosum]|uniref:Uncharacterized protein n=1 Tax=Penicillium bovifimosum TaxID=126998 RepID=A0A9W9GIK4_9EURO|nr:uncharacterized protein N7515_009054 [Penicillium bovifimosum]KAJ5121093.1 hypothetical protein N7515_009054 [Penicillium bovifimosum]
MCYRVIERYSVCKCLYFEHSVDPCSSYGQHGHEVEEKLVLVGYACDRHTLCSDLSLSAVPSGAITSLWSDAGHGRDSEAKKLREGEFELQKDLGLLNPEYR